VRAWEKKENNYVDFKLKDGGYRDSLAGTPITTTLTRTCE